MPTTMAKQFLVPSCIRQPRSEPDYYGASHLIAKAVRRRQIPKSYASWKHGWGGIRPLCYPEQLIFHHKPWLNILVHTSEQEFFLREKGFANVHAVGVPFAYAMHLCKPRSRKPDSLLVMPPHISKFVAPRYNEIAYVQHISEFRDDFCEITVCISGECERQGRWRNSFEKAGFDVIVGADVYDMHSLPRMRALFSLFDVVTSPNLGSHILYAALSGCRISICGPINEGRRMDFSKEPFYKRNPHLLDLAFSDAAKSHKKQLMERFSCEPPNALTHEAWAQGEAGAENIREPEELAKLLGWDTVTQIAKVVEAFSYRAARKVLAGRVQR